MIETATLRPASLFTARAFVLRGLALVPDNMEFHIYHKKSGLLVIGSIPRQVALKAVRELVSLDVDWENITVDEFQKVPKELKSRIDAIVEVVRLHDRDLYYR